MSKIRCFLSQKGSGAEQGLKILADCHTVTSSVY